jgi:hypothetical protein
LFTGDVGETPHPLWKVHGTWHYVRILISSIVTLKQRELFLLARAVYIPMVVHGSFLVLDARAKMNMKWCLVVM